MIVKDDLQERGTFEYCLQSWDINLIILIYTIGLIQLGIHQQLLLNELMSQVRRLSQAL